MGQHVCMGAMMMCSFGVAPSSLLITSQFTEMSGGPMGATIMDYAPIANIPPFGMCTTPSNPTVASATAAALGVLTPMPCVPATAAPWVPGSPTVLVNNFPALDSNSKLICSYGGVIQITFAGEVTVMLP